MPFFFSIKISNLLFVPSTVTVLCYTQNTCTFFRFGPIATNYHWQLLFPSTMIPAYSLLFRWSFYYRQLSKLLILFVGVVIAKIEFSGQDCSERCKNIMFRSWFLHNFKVIKLGNSIGLCWLFFYWTCRPVFLSIHKAYLQRNVHLWSITASFNWG